jgi:hypothetical protein
MISYVEVDRTYNEHEIDELFGFDVTGLSWSHDKHGSMILHVKGLRFEK